MRASRTSTHTPDRWEARVPKEYSGPHQNVMKALIRAGFGSGLESEQPVTCKPCGQPNCHHKWKADLLLHHRIVIDPHRNRNPKDVDKQARRKACLENSDYKVIPCGTKRGEPGRVVEEIRRELAR